MKIKDLMEFFAESGVKVGIYGDSHADEEVYSVDVWTMSWKRDLEERNKEVIG